MDPIKEAFSKIKREITQLKEEISILKAHVGDIQTTQTDNTLNIPRQTNRQTDIQAQKRVENPVYPPNFDSSIGNEGVPTNRQTDKQTNRQLHPN